MYRKSAQPPTEGRLVTLKRYLDPLAAQLDRTRLGSEGVVAHVIEAASFNPLLAGAAGGVQLQVGERDVDRAEAILSALSPTEAEGADDGEGEGAVRCPRCELPYCFLERARPAGASAALGAPLVLVAMVLAAFGPRRWHCHKCDHVWDDPREGPTAVTPAEPGDPRPVFRLHRAHAGMGLFLGGMGGLLGAALLGGGPPGLLVLLALAALGWRVGRGLRHDVCSAPACRAPLTAEVEVCPRCKGHLAGVVRTAGEHHAAAADFRRELWALRARDEKGPLLAKKPRLRPAG